MYRRHKSIVILALNHWYKICLCLIHRGCKCTIKKSLAVIQSSVIRDYPSSDGSLSCQCVVRSYTISSHTHQCFKMLSLVTGCSCLQKATKPSMLMWNMGEEKVLKLTINIDLILYMMIIMIHKYLLLSYHNDIHKLLNLFQLIYCWTG